MLKTLFGVVMTILIVSPILWYAEWLPADGVVHALVQVEVQAIGMVVDSVRETVHRYV